MSNLTTKLPILLLGFLLPFTGYSQARSKTTGTYDDGLTRRSTGTAATGTNLAAAKRSPVIPETASVLGAHIGYTNVDQIDSGTLSVGATYDYAVADNLLVGASLDYWREDYNIALDRTADVSDLILGGHAKLLFSQFNLPVRPYGLLGLTAHRLRVKEARVMQPQAGRVAVDPKTDEVTDTEAQIGVDVAAGVAYGINREVDVTAEVRWRNILEDSIAYDQIALTGGVSYIL